MWWLTGADLALPFGEIIYLGGIAILGLTAIGTAERATAVPKYQYRTKEKAEEKVAEKSLPNFTYWKAYLLNNKVVLGDGLSFTEAKEWVAAGNNIMCLTHDAALAIIIANNYRNAVGPEISFGDGFFWHYHPTRNHKGSASVHIWYMV